MIRRFYAIGPSRRAWLASLLLISAGAIAQTAALQDVRSGGGQSWAGQEMQSERSPGDFQSGSDRSGDPTVGTPSRIRDSNTGPGRSSRGALSVPTMSGGQQVEATTPPVPNEFQKFVAESTGKLLPIFGADFFAAANAYTPLQSVPVPGDYPLGPGDELLIRGWGSVDIDFRAVIDRDGAISIPKIGTVSLAGVSAGKVEDVLRAAIGRVYRGFGLNVTYGQLRGITIYVVGHARRPGTYTVSSLSTLITALFQSGGPNPNGSLRHVQVKRAGKLVGEMDVYAFLARGDKTADIKLLDGDVIVIPPVGGYVALTGMVDVPAIFELSGSDDTIEGLLAVAGSVSVLADPRRLIIEHIDPERKQPRTVEEIRLDAAGLRKTLKAGDLISVLPISPEFANAVTLRVGERGAFRLPLRLPFRPGMRISDVIPDKESLLSRAAVLRQNSYERKKAEQQDDSRLVSRQGEGRVGGRVDEFKVTRQGIAESKRLDDRLDGERGGADQVSYEHKPGDQYDQFNWHYAVVERLNRTDLTVSLVPFNLGQALADPGSPDNVSLQAGDTITVFSANDVRGPIAKRPVLVRIEGEVKQPGVYQVEPGESIVNILGKAGGLTVDAYLFGTEFYRESVRKLQQENLEKFINRLEQQSLSEAGRLAANVTTGDPGAANLVQSRLAAEAESRKRFVDHLRTMKSSGRMALGLGTKDINLAHIPPFRLESGDRLVVPNRPDFVQVAGSVNTESALLWQPGRSVSDYLTMAGATRDADKDNMFVIRADGTIVSNTSRWISSVAGLEAMPGDVVVVPESLDKEGFWTAFTRNAKDVTQIFYQLGLGAAAIKSLR